MEPDWFKSGHASLLQRSLISDFCNTDMSSIKLRESENAWTRNACSFNYTPTSRGAFFTFPKRDFKDLICSKAQKITKIAQNANSDEASENYSKM